VGHSINTEQLLADIACMDSKLSSSHQLRGNFVTADPRLDRLREVDLRSLDFSVRRRLSDQQLLFPRSYTWNVPIVLDQGPDGACVGFGFAHELAARPVAVTGIDFEFARDIYWQAQRADDWSGGAYPGARPFYEGTSVLAGAKVMVRRGFFESYDWALNLNELVSAVSYRGPAVMGVDWYEGMFEPDDSGFVHPRGEIAGGHCVCIAGVTVRRNAEAKLDPVSSYFTIVNSWGSGWGVNGRCRLTLLEMMKLWPGGEFCIPSGRSQEG
jgi:hypothetical protein